jgi:hypothetical protein
MKVARPKMVQTGEDVSKSECLSVMDRIEASALTLKGANLKQVFHGKEGRYTSESAAFNDAS